MLKKIMNLAVLLLVSIPIIMILSNPAFAQVQQAWVQRYDGSVSGDHQAYAIALDGSGNVYVTGESYGVGTYGDYATIKYNTTGAPSWAQRYNGPASAWDYAYAITVDGSGNVYVTGSSAGSGTNDDYATIKYAADGTQQWVQRYNGPANLHDRAYAIAVDVSGNVYVTGWSQVSGSDGDYATIKYNSSGAQQWVQRYNGPGNGDDMAYAIAVDGSGNVYVTGYSLGSGIDKDYATIKYNTNGTQFWVQRYNGPGNGWDGAYAIAVDGSGNVYVTGASQGSGTSLDYATIKYNTNGTQLWVTRYSGPGTNDYGKTISIDGSGNVYVTGSSCNSALNFDYATIKYNTNGTQLWVQRYNGPANGMDEAEDIKVDGSGNVYVTGYSPGSGTGDDYATIKYNTNGTQLWVTRYNYPANQNDQARAIAVDGSGNVYVTGYQSCGSAIGEEYVTIAYDPSGSQVWVQAYHGWGYWDDKASAIALDGSGNVYVTGGSQGSGMLADYATIKYDLNGTQLWATKYNGPAGGEDNARGIAVDGSGNVYVTGSSSNSALNFDYATVKYSPNGNQLWVQRYNGPANGVDEAFAIAVDGSGNVYVTGYSLGSGTYGDYATIKYNSSGAQQWVQRYNGPGNGEDAAFGIAVDNAGNVYVTGGSTGSGTSEDYATIKYNTNGTQLWVQRYNGPGNSDDDAFAIAVDGSGNVYVTGASQGSGTGDDYATIKYNSSGAQQWVQRYNGPGNGEDYVSGIAVDNAGNVYVTGHSSGSGTEEDYATIKYNPNGTQLWVQRYDGPAHSFDEACAIAVDGSGNVYVSGTSYGSETENDYATIKYDPNGTQLWVTRYNGPAGGYDKARGIAVDGSGNVYVTGASLDLGTSYDYATIKYVQPAFLRGDANGDGVINIADVVYLINYLFVGGPAPVPLEAGDANCDGVVNIADAVYLINYLFIGGPPPCEGKGTTSSGLELYKGKVPARIGFSSPNISKDGILNVPIMGEFDMDLAGIQLEIKYDPEKITLLESELTPRTEGLSIYSSFKETQAKACGYKDLQKIDSFCSLQVGIVDLSGKHYISAGTGALVNLRMKGSDLSSLEITTAILVDKKAQKIPVQIVSKMKESEEESAEEKSAIPQEFSLSQNYPNPFNPETEIKYALPKDCDVKLIIYNILGEKIKVLVNEHQRAGFKTVYWNGTDDKGEKVGSGIYFYKLEAGDFKESRKMVLIK